MAMYKILRNSAQKAKFPQVQKTPSRDPISGIFTCVPLLWPTPKILKFPKKFPNLMHLTAISAFSRSPLLKGPYTDLILSATRFNITYLLIYFFIQ
jgi:hypothetical protein